MPHYARINFLLTWVMCLSVRRVLILAVVKQFNYAGLK
jgi:hypothetical protein